MVHRVSDTCGWARSVSEPLNVAALEAQFARTRSTDSTEAISLVDALAIARAFHDDGEGMFLSVLHLGRLESLSLIGRLCQLLQFATSVDVNGINDFSALVVALEAAHESRPTTDGVTDE